MIELVRPKCFIPVHGTIHHLTRHGALASEVGVANVAVIENGRVAELEGGTVTVRETMPTGRVHVWAGREIPPAVLREREVLGEEGFASCSVVITGSQGASATGEVVEISLVTRGVVDEALNAEEMEAARSAVRLAISELARLDPHADDARIGEQSRLAVRRTFWKSRGKKPMTVVHVLRRERSGG